MLTSELYGLGMYVGDKIGSGVYKVNLRVVLSLIVLGKSVFEGGVNVTSN